MVVEKFQHADVGEHVGNAECEVLRHEPEDAHWDCGNWVVQEAVGFSLVDALHLHKCCNDHGNDREDEANADSLEKCDASVKAGVAASVGDEDAVVEGDQDGHDDEREEGNGRGGEFETADVPVHCGALLDREGLQLREHDIHDDGARPDWHQLHYSLRFFDLCHGA